MWKHYRRHLSWALLASAGCLGPQRSDYLSTLPVSIDARSEAADGLWTTIQETLRHHRFQLDRVDRGAGVVTTMHATSQNLFEFWRHDVDTREDLWESTLNPIRRRVEVRLDRDDAGWSRVSVAVYKQRFSSPDRQFNSTGALYQYFGDRLPSTTGQIRVTEKDETWYDVGRDPAMEEYFLRRILDSAMDPAESESPGDTSALKTP